MTIQPPGPGHRHAALARLAGRWRVDMTTHGPDGPTNSVEPLTAAARMIGGGRYVEERIEGTFAGGRHEKLSVLGFNATRDRFELVTADDHDAVLLHFVSRPGEAGDDDRIDLFADYVSPGDAAPRGVLLTVRTQILVEGADRRRLVNAYRAPGGAEEPFLEYVYTRVEE